MLQDELDWRRSRLTERGFKQSGLDERLSLADFDWRFNPKIPRHQIPGLNVPPNSRPLLPDLKLEAASEFEAFKYLFQ